MPVTPRIVPGTPTARRRLCFVLALFIVTGASGFSAAAPQFGAIGGAARRAAEEAKKKAEDAKKAEEAKRQADEAAKTQPASPAADAQGAATSSPAASSATAAPPEPAALSAASAPSFQSYSKYDFVPGEKIVAVDDFTQDGIGDFPARWNTNASGEIVTLAGQPGRWFKLTRAGFFTPDS